MSLKPRKSQSAVFFANFSTFCMTLQDRYVHRPLSRRVCQPGTWISDISIHLTRRQPANYENGSGASTILAEQYTTTIRNKKLSLPFDNLTEGNLIFHT